MNDAERDAWLREALRHAPDADALPPSGVSEAILLKARAAARAAAPTGRRAASREAPANPLAAFWRWLARPPVAAGFASVMAATLIGLMWWDRPIDEGMPPPPTAASEQMRAAPSPAPTSPSDEIPPASRAPAPAAAPAATLTESTPATVPTPEPRAKNAAADAGAADGAVARRPGRLPEQSGAADAQRAEPSPAPAPARRSADLPAKENAPSAEKKKEAPAPFPSAETQREMSSTRKSLDAGAANDAKKKDVDANRSRAVDDFGRAAAPDDGKAATPTEEAVGAQAKSAAAAPSVSATPAATPPAAPARDRAEAAPLQQRQSAAGALREKDAAGLASPAPLPFSVESERARSESLARADPSARAVVPARLLAAIAAEPERWRRQTAAGDTVALDPGWRAWLAEIDAAAAGRWQPLGVGAPPADAPAARDGSTTVRLVSGGRVAAIVRVDGSRMQVDAVPGSSAGRWAATLLPADAERLRSTARRLSP